MLKKYTSYLGIIMLACFSFYYTDRAVDIVKRNDPIMKEIIKNKDNYLIKSVNATINNDEIIPGIYGMQVNVNKSYENMKKNNTYDEDLYVFEEIIPNVSLKYDKYIVSGNEKNNKIALVFKLNSNYYINKVNDILLNKIVAATFFIDGSIIEDNLDKIIELAENYEIENLGYDKEYSEERFEWTNNLLFSITKKDPRFCYTDYKNEKILELCGKYKMYTIKPSISITSYPLLEIRNNIKNGSIISFNLDNEVIKELPSIISYIKQKGYKLVTLTELINEKY